MRKILLLLGVLAFAGGAAIAENPEDYDIGVGAVLGGFAPAVSAKYWIDKANGVDAALSLITKKDAYFHVTYLYHDYEALPEPGEGKLPLYYGGGAAFMPDHRIGVRGAMGVEYLFKDYPCDIFIELAPVVIVNPEFDITFTGGIGARYFWGRE